MKTYYYEANKALRLSLFLTCAILLSILFNQSIVAQPVIAAFTPKSGPVGTVVKITGSNFSTGVNNNIVYMGGVRAAVSSATTTSLTVMVPKGAASKPLTVTSNNLTAYASLPFIITFEGTDTAFLPTSFESKLDFSLGSQGYGGPSGILLYDFDGDGKQDILAPNYTFNRDATILRNLSSPDTIFFGEVKNFDLPGSPHGAAVGDFDGDGKPDIAVTSDFDYAISIFKNTSVPQTINFGPRINIDSIVPFSIACADIDGDGKPDLVTTVFLDDKIVILKNSTINGNISFNSKIQLKVGDSPLFLSIGDMDGDGKPDIVTSNTASGNISILRNTSTNGIISFASKVDYVSGEYTRHVAMGDLDGDGKIDLAVTNEISKTISIFKNNSTPGVISLLPRLDLQTVYSAYGINMEDLDGDGDLDVAVATVYANAVSVFKNTSTPGSISLSSKIDYNTGQEPYYIAMADLDGDGKPDLALGNKSSGSVSLIKNKTNKPTLTSVSPTVAYTDSTITITGFNLMATNGVSIGGIPVRSFTVISPTIIKAVIGGGASGNVLVTTPYGTAIISGFVFMPPPQINVVSPLVATKGSTINIYGNYLSGTRKVSFGGVPALSFKIISATNISAIVSDGATGGITVENETGITTFLGFKYVLRPTIRTINPAYGPIGTQVTISGNNFDNVSGGLSVFFGAVKAVITAATDTSLIVTVPYGCTNAPVSVTSNFLTGFFTKPFVPTFPGAGAILVSHSFASKLDLPAGNNPSGLAVSDFDGDGNLEIAASNNTSYISVYKSLTTNGTISLSAKQDYFAGGPSASLCAGDLDGDGKQDLVVIKPLSQSIVTCRNISSQGNIAFSNPQNITIFATGDQASDLSIADIDGDGRPDVVVANSSPNTISIYRNTSLPGQISFDTKLDFPTGSGNKSFSISDLNLDGKPEIVISTSNTGVITIYKNFSTPGAISIDQNSPIIISHSGMGVCIGDFDGNGKPDIAVNNYSGQANSSVVSVFKNTGTGEVISFAPAIDFFAGGATGDIAAIDLDGDSKLDLALVNTSLPSISLLKNIGIGSIAFADRFDCPTANNPQAFLMADFDRDGQPDIALTNLGSNTFSIIRNKVGKPIVTPSGANPVTGNIINRVSVDSSVQTYKGVSYVQRHYDIEPQNSPSSATATVTLFFTQADFDNFNVFPGHGLNLPSAPDDNAGKAALRIYQYHGFSSTGEPGSYPEGVRVIDPEDINIIWNASAQWWEVSFDVVGFSGFFAGTNIDLILPLKLINFTVNKQNTNNMVSWTTANETDMSYFEVQRSSDASSYVVMATIAALNQNAITHEYQYKDVPGTDSAYYYRLKMVDKNGLITFSKIVTVNLNSTNGVLHVYPNPIEHDALVSHPLNRSGAQLQLVDMTGRVVRTFAVGLNSNSTKINTDLLSSGIYKIVWADPGKLLSQLILIK